MKKFNPGEEVLDSEEFLKLYMIKYNKNGLLTLNL